MFANASSLRHRPFVRTLTPLVVPAGRPPDSPVDRWAQAVAAVVAAPVDVPTLDAWAARIGMSRSTLVLRCLAASLPAKPSLTLGRLLRTLRDGDAEAWRPDLVLNAADPRTLASLVAKAGVRPYCGRPRPSVAVFLEAYRPPIPALARAALRRRCSDLVPT